MARVYGIKKRLEQNNVDPKLAKEIIGSGDLVDIIMRMEKALDFETMYQILDTCACGGGRDFIKLCERMGKELSGKSLRNKVNYINNDSADIKLALNDDGTLTETMSFRNGDKYKCVCGAMVNKGFRVCDLVPENGEKERRVMPLAYCFCCAGSCRRDLQLQLGVDLKTREIISSPINSSGTQPCEFIFEINPKD